MLKQTKIRQSLASGRIVNYYSYEQEHGAGARHLKPKGAVQPVPKGYLVTGVNSRTCNTCDIFHCKQPCTEVDGRKVGRKTSKVRVNDTGRWKQERQATILSSVKLGANGRRKQLSGTENTGYDYIDPPHKDYEWYLCFT